MELISEIFRSAHSLKSQSAAMEYNDIAFLCHVIEDIFYEIKQKRLKLTSELADLLFSSLDELIASIENVDKQNIELPLKNAAEKLKELSGVNTAGVGKSKRDDGGDNSSNSTNSTKQESLTNKELDKINVQPPPTIKTINVKTEQLDNLMNLVEELLEKRLVLKQYIERFGMNDLHDYFDETKRIVDNLYYQTMKIRTIPLSLVFEHFPRAIRDLARSTGKEIDLQIIGGDLELDRSIVDRLDEPIIHILRNAMSHGIEQKGTIILSARRESDLIIIEISDNGKGIDWEKIAKKANLNSLDKSILKKALFSGISTSSEVTQISGRGVGLQVVKKMVDSMGGSIDVESEKEKGTTFRMILPLTLAITKALVVKIGKQKYAIPTPIIDRSINIPNVDIQKSEDSEFFIYDKKSIPLLRLSQKLGVTFRNVQSAEDNPIVIVSLKSKKIGLAVDAIMEILEIIVKPVPTILRHNSYFSGTTILGDGKTSFIINPQGFI